MANAKSIDEFEIVQELGDGSFGVVLKCQRKGTGEMVAIKKMKKRFSSQSECRSLREVKALECLRSGPNIVKLHHIFLEKKTLYMVFECMDLNLFQLLKDRNGKRLEEATVRSIVFQVLRGLQHMHALGIIHRDMKPENLLISGSVVKIADLGLARDVKSRPPYTDYVSTRWYRAPEVLLRSSSYSCAIDLWAVGTIAAELINLKPLFPGCSEVDQVYRICEVLGNPTELPTSASISTSPVNGGGGTRTSTPATGEVSPSTPPPTTNYTTTTLSTEGSFAPGIDLLTKPLPLPPSPSSPLLAPTVPTTNTLTSTPLLAAPTSFSPGVTFAPTISTIPPQPTIITSPSSLVGQDPGIGGKWKDGVQLARRMGFSFPTVPVVPLDMMVTRAPVLALELIQGFLQYEPKHRTTAFAALHSAWFQHEDMESELEAIRDLVDIQPAFPESNPTKRRSLFSGLRSSSFKKDKDNKQPVLAPDPTSTAGLASNVVVAAAAAAAAAAVTATGSVAGSLSSTGTGTGTGSITTTTTTTVGTNFTLSSSLPSSLLSPPQLLPQQQAQQPQGHPVPKYRQQSYDGSPRASHKSILGSGHSSILGISLGHRSINSSHGTSFFGSSSFSSSPTTTTTSTAAGVPITVNISHGSGDLSSSSSGDSSSLSSSPLFSFPLGEETLYSLSPQKVSFLTKDLPARP